MYNNGFTPMTQFSYCIYSWCLLYVTKHLCFYSEADTHLYCKYYVVGCCVRPNGSVRSREGKCGLRKEIDKRQQTELGGHPVDTVIGLKFTILSSYMPRSKKDKGLPCHYAKNK